MGRTNATYRNHLDKFIQKFKPYRKGLRKENKKHLDSLWEKAHGFGQAGAYMNSSNPSLPAIISIILGLQKEVSKNQREIQRLEKKIKKLEDGIQD